MTPAEIRELKAQKMEKKRQELENMTLSEIQDMRSKGAFRGRDLDLAGYRMAGFFGGFEPAAGQYHAKTEPVAIEADLLDFMAACGCNLRMPYL
jgi:hypothetical protein